MLIYFLSPFVKYLERKLVDESEEISLRRDFAPDEALGEDTPTIKSWGALCSVVKCRHVGEDQISS